MSQKRKSDDDADDSKLQTAQPIVVAAQRRNIWYLLLALRLVNAFTLATFFQPDEYYQSLEPAWAMVFGKGSSSEWMGGAYDGPWITWEWRHGLRSAMYPMIYAVVYKITHFISNLVLSPALATTALLYAPKLVQGVGAAAMDYYTWALAGRVFGGNSIEASAVLALTVTSPWQWFVSTRSMSSCLETTFAAMAMYFWPWESMKTAPSREGLIKDAARLKYSVIMAALATVLRPTSFIIWGTLTLSLLLHNRQAGFALMRTGFVWGAVVLLFSTSLDVWYYKKLTFPPVNFYIYNIQEGLSAFYGENRVDYYFTEGIPMLLSTALPFAITGISQALSGRFLALPADTRGGAIHPAIMRSLGLVIVVLPITLSFISHKEARFIYPILPAMFVVLARPIIGFFHPFPYPSSIARKVLLGSVLSLNLALAGYLGFIHNSGPIKAMDYLRSEHERLNPGLVKHGQTTDVNVTQIAVMMPCHSVPWRSQLIYNEIQGWQLTCEPPIDVSDAEKEEYLDEADFFYDDPQTWMKAEFAQQKRFWPDFVVVHDDVREEMMTLVNPTAFEEAWRKFNSIWHADWRRQGPVVVMAKTLGYGGPGRRHNPMPEDTPDPRQEELEEMLKKGSVSESEMMNDQKAASAKAKLAKIKERKWRSKQQKEAKS